MTGTAAEAMFDAYVAAWNAHSVDELLGFFVDACVYEDAALGRRSEGKDELRAFFEEAFVACPDFQLEYHDLFVSADRYASEWTMTGSDHGAIPGVPATGKPFRVRGASVGQLSGTRLVKNVDYWNIAEMLMQIGALPSLPT